MKSRSIAVLLPMAILAAILSMAPAQAPRLLPFQGKLTDSAGVAVPDGAKVIQFRLYDAPTAGNVVWPGEVHTVTVNGGLVNVLLGTQSAFTDPALFNRTVYLEITVDVNGDKVINASDPAMQPRQLIVPVIFAQDAGKLEGQRWQDFFVDPNGGDPAAAPQDARVKDAGKLQDKDWTDFFTTDDPATAKAKQAAAADSAANAQALGGVTPEKLLVTPVDPMAPKAKAAAVADRAVTADSAQTAAVAQGLTAEAAGRVVPVGTIIAFAGVVEDTGGVVEPEPGYLLCNGAMIDTSRAGGAYAPLVQKLGTAWGNGGDADPLTVNLPDLRGVFLRGVSGTATDGFADPDAGERTARLPGGNTGNEAGSFQADEVGSHSHAISFQRTGGGVNATRIAGTSDTGTATTRNAGSNGGSESRPRNAGVYYLVRY